MHAHIQAVYLLNVTLFIILSLQSVVKKATPCSSSSCSDDCDISVMEKASWSVLSVPLLG